MKFLLPILLAALSFGQTTVPTLVDGTNFPARGPSSGNPYLFVRGGSIYLVEFGETAGGQLGIWKCTLTGSSCSQMDASNRPSDALQAFVAFSAPLSTTIEAVYQSQSFPTNQLKFVVFDTATDTWAAASTALTLGIPSGQTPLTQGAGQALIQKNNGTYYLYMLDTVAAVFRLGYYTFSAGTWSGFTTVEADEVPIILSVARDDSTEQVNLFYEDATHSNELTYLQIAADDTPGTHTLLPGGQNANNTDVISAKVIGSTLYAIYNDTEGAGLTCPNPPGVYRVMELSTPTASISFTSTVIFTAPDCDSQTRTHWAAIGIDNGTRVNAFWDFNDVSGSPTVSEISQSVLTAGVWGAPTTFYNEEANRPVGPSFNHNYPAQIDAVCESDMWAMPLTLLWGTEVGYLYVNGSATCTAPPARKIVHRASAN